MRMNPFGEGWGAFAAWPPLQPPSELRQLVRQALRDTPTVELRLDWLRNDQERQEFLELAEEISPRRAQVIVATCRRRIGGGELAGDAGAELYWLMKARKRDASGATWKWRHCGNCREKPCEGYAVPEKVMLSMHDFRRTPKLPKRLNVPPRGGVDAIKVAAMARSIADSVRL